MDKISRELYSQSIFKQALRRFDIDQRMVKELEGFQNFIYEYKKIEKAIS